MVLVGCALRLSHGVHKFESTLKSTIKKSHLQFCYHFSNIIDLFFSVALKTSYLVLMQINVFQSKKCRQKVTKLRLNID